MTDILIMPDGSRWKPSTSTDVVECANCDNVVDTPEEIASYKDVVNTADATDVLSSSKEVMALITVLAPLHEMSVEALTNAVIAQLKNEEA